MSNVTDLIPADSLSWLPPIMGTLPGWGLLVAFLVTVLKIWPAVRKLQNESDASLRTDLMKRVKELEDRLRDEQRECEQQIAELRGQLDGVMRQFIQYQIAVGQAIPLSKRSPEIEAAMQSLIRTFSGKGEGQP